MDFGLLILWQESLYTAYRMRSRFSCSARSAARRASSSCLRCSCSAKRRFSNSACPLSKLAFLRSSKVTTVRETKTLSSCFHSFNCITSKNMKSWIWSNILVTSSISCVKKKVTKTPRLFCSIFQLYLVWNRNGIFFKLRICFMECLIYFQM